MLIGLPPFLIIRFVPSNGNENGFSEKICEISYEKFFSSLYTHEKGKNSRVFKIIHTNFIIDLFALTQTLGRGQKSTPCAKKVFILILNSQENAEIKDFEKIFFYSSLISLGKVQKVNHITKILGFFYFTHPKLTRKQKNEGFLKNIFYSS